MSLTCSRCHRLVDHTNAYLDATSYDETVVIATCHLCQQAADLDGAPCSSPGCPNDAVTIVDRGELCATCSMQQPAELVADVLFLGQLLYRDGRYLVRQRGVVVAEGGSAKEAMRAAQERD